MIYLFQILLTLFVFFYGLANNYSSVNCVLIPLVYSSSFLIFSRSSNYKKIKKDYIWYFLYIILFLKYYVTPLSQAFTRKMSDVSPLFSSGPLPSQDSLELSVYLLSFECLFIILILSFLSKFTAKKQKEKQIPNLVRIIYITLFFILSFLLNPSFLKFDNLNFLLFTDNVEILEISTMGSFVTSIFFFLSLTFILDYILRHYKSTHKKKYIVYYFFSFLVFIVVNLSDSRWTILFSILMSLLLYNSYIGKIGKKYFAFIGILFVILFIEVSFYKYRWDLNGKHSLPLLFNSFISSFQAYFSGPILVAKGLDMFKYGQLTITYQNLLKDFTTCIPFLHKYLDVSYSDTTNAMFCNYLDKPGNLLPQVAVGYGFGGILLSNIFSSVWIPLIFYFKEKANKTNLLDEKYVFYLISLWMAISVCVDVHNSFGHLITNLLLYGIIYSMSSSFIKCVKK